MKIDQIEIVTIEDLVKADHPYRKLKKLINFNELIASAKIKDKELGAIGYTVKRLMMCLILQFMENLSDRECGRFMSENNAGKWFCEFGLSEKTPDYTTFCKFRNKLGTEKIEKIFEETRSQLKSKGYLSEIFTFIDASALVSKLNMWEERDKAISAGYEKFNNEVIEKYAKDKDVRIGSKGKNKFWFGYKKHVSVDMQDGLINKVKVTKANVSDADGLDDVCPSQGAVATDKGYIAAIGIIEKNNCHPMVILKKNMKEKNPDKDRWISGLRSPYERTFSKQQKRVRYKGTQKNQAAEFLYAIAYNFKRLLVLEEEIVNSF